MGRSSAERPVVGKKMTRRRLFRWTAATAGVGALVAAGGGAWFGMTYFNAKINTIGKVAFDRALAIPPLAQSEVKDDVRVFELTMQQGESDLGQGGLTRTWGINGPHLGPTIRARRDDQVKVRVTNNLGEASTLHWHGMHLPAEMDGGPHQVIPAGETWTPTWVIDQSAASLWYHPHPHGVTARHVYRGLAGMFIIDDDDEGALLLPRNYGIDDIPLIVQDRKFNSDGSFDESPSVWQSDGIIGDTILVNGTPGPYFDVTTQIVRLRILNGSNTRPYNFAFDDERTFSVIGTDGGLLEAPVTMNKVQLSPGERVEIVVVFTPGERVRLQSGPSDTRNRLSGGTDSLDIIEFRAGDGLDGISHVPSQLVAIPRIDESSAIRTRDFELSGFAVNGQVMDMARIDDVVVLDDTEIWTVTSLDEMTHNFHIHDVQFQILDIDGQQPPPHLLGWKDTIWLPQGQRFRLIMTFTDYASHEWPYMYHCHILRHEDQGLMGQFLVVEPGQSTRPDDYSLNNDHDGH